MKHIGTFFISFLCCQVFTLSSAFAVEFMWEWNPSGSRGANAVGQDVLFDLCMRSEFESKYDFDDPVVSGIDDCWWKNDRYVCQAGLDMEFTPGVKYYFVVIAHNAEEPLIRSSSSNEVTYSAAHTDSEVGENGVSVGEGGCFISGQ